MRSISDVRPSGASLEKVKTFVSTRIQPFWNKGDVPSS
jgi:hypothetical protein